MPIRYLFISIFYLCFFVACNHLNSSCLEINWYELGRQDSTQGFKMEKSFSKRQKVCPISLNSIYAKAYENGFLSGLTTYCSFKTGYIYSLSQMDQEVSACPEDLKIKFMKGYEIGSYMKQIQSLQTEIKQKIETVNQKLENRNSHFSMTENL